MPYFEIRREKSPRSVADLARSVESPEAIVCELPLPGWEAKEILALARRHHPGVPVVFLLAEFGLDEALALRSAGATEVLPGDADITRIAALQRPGRGRLATGEMPEWRRRLIGSCLAMEKLGEAIATIAERRSTVLITG